MSLLDIAGRLAPRLPALDDDDLQHIFCKACTPGPYPRAARALCGTNSLALGIAAWIDTPHTCVVCADLIVRKCPRCGG